MEKKVQRLASSNNIKSISQKLLLAFLTARGTEDECPLEEVEEFIVNDDSGYFDTNFCSAECLDIWLHFFTNYDIIKEEDEDNGYEETHTYTIANAEGTITITTGKSLWEYKEEMGY